MKQSSRTDAEIASQPAVWARAAEVGRAHAHQLVGHGRGLIFGCGTSAFVAQVLAWAREAAGRGETDAAFASEILPRAYDHVIAICRSATTTEILAALDRLAGRGSVGALGITAVHAPINEPLAQRCGGLIVLDFADEQSVVQTRFPTAQIAMFRAALGESVDFAAMAADALAAELPSLDGHEHFVYLADGANIGYANEAALKIREMAQAWSESHLALDYRHGPIAVAGPRSLIQVFGTPPARLVDELLATGATVVSDQRDPLAQLVIAQRIALAVCRRRGLDPDAPRGLTRSVVLAT